MNSTFPMFFFKPAGVKLDSAPCCKEKHYTVRAMESKNVRPRDPEVVELTGKKGANSLIKPFTRQNLFCYYVPALGTASYTVLSINVLNPYLQYR